MLNSLFSKHTKASTTTPEKKSDPYLLYSTAAKAREEARENKSESELFNTYKNDTNSSMNIITHGSLMEGTINVADEKGEIKIAGKIIGEVICSGKVIIEESGVVEGNIKTVYLENSGTLKGTADVVEECVLSSTGYIEGDIVVGVLNINAGAKVNGNIQMKDAQNQAPSQEPNPKTEAAIKLPSFAIAQ